MSLYCYAGGDPINFMDPDGRFFKSIFKFFKKVFKAVAKFVKKYWKPILAIAVAIAVPMFATGAIQAALGVGLKTAKIIAGSIGGAIGGAITGGLRGAAYGAISGGMFAGVGVAYKSLLDAKVNATLALGVKALGHGIAGGVSARMYGGKFETGFVSGFFTGLLTPVADEVETYLGKNGFPGIAEYGGYATAGVTGGIAAELSGGDFEYGAVTGIFSRAFNKKLTEIEGEGEYFREEA